MTSKKMNPIVRAITDALWERDRLEMRAVDAVLSVLAAKRPGRRRRQRRHTTSRGKR